MLLALKLIFHGKKTWWLARTWAYKKWNNRPTQTLVISLEVYDNVDITNILKQDICILVKQ